jgi:hypothetical protein
MGGTFDMALVESSGFSTPLAVGTDWGMRWGPARCWVLRDRMETFVPRAFRRRLCVGGVEHRPYFENYTVDASILKDSGLRV